MSSATSALYDEIYARGNWTAQTKLDVYPPDSDTLFYSFGEDRLIEMKTTRGLMPSGEFSVGNAIVGEINVVLYPTNENEDPLSLPKNATLIPYFRLFDSETEETSEWVQKGIFNIESRKYDRESGKLEIYGYDPMRRLETGISWTETKNENEELLDLIAGIMGVDVDPLTYETIDSSAALNLEPINSDTITGAQEELNARYVLECLCGTYFANAFLTNEGKLLVLRLKNTNAQTVGCTGYDKRNYSSRKRITGVNAVFDAFGDNESVFFGTNESAVVSVSCPYYSLTNNEFPSMLTQYALFYVIPHTTEGAIIDPSADLGDKYLDPREPQIPGNIYERFIYRQAVHFGPLMKSDVEVPNNEMSEYETNYQGPQSGGSFYQTQLNRDLAARPTFDQVSGAVFGGAIAIPQNSDLDDYTTPGVYAITTSAIAATLTNAPLQRAGRLTVISAVGKKYTSSSDYVYFRQIYEAYTGQIYQRYGTSSTGLTNITWKDWQTIATQGWTEDLVFNAGTSLAGTETLTALSIGKYEANTAAIAAALQNVSTGNCPTSNNFMLVVYNRLSTPRKSLRIEDSQGDVYIKQQSGSSSWTSWKKLTSTTV